MILSDATITKAVKKGDLGISEFSEMQLNPHSYNLRLSKYYREFSDYSFDFGKDNQAKYSELKVMPVGGLILSPEKLYLMSTVEEINLVKYVGEVSGRSSVGRAGLLVHCTAGFIDYGFRGHITLEVGIIGTHYVKVYPNMEICQIKFYKADKPNTAYSGRYQGQGHSEPSRYIFNKPQ
jgi:dCTP deaminase